jgi:hypothetical protein
MNKFNKIIFMMMVSAPFVTHAENHNKTGNDGETCSSSKKAKGDNNAKHSNKKTGLHQTWNKKYQKNSDQKDSESKS